jgi:class 3 adenylate cyclase
VRCAACGTENRPGRKFCAECGAPLAVACDACGAANEPGERFCGECGAPLEEAAPAGAAAPPAATAERRLVSVLFADLVGFTTASEGRDPEEVRELLSRYFDAARRVLERFGGTIEKFIGDAVMAVWGAPVAREDDAERAVRAALDLVEAVAVLGEESGIPDLRARAAVLTGEAAVTLGAEGEGMVAGDLVNTASRVQGIAEPGTVLVGEGTRRASEAAIAYEDAGRHTLRGKADEVSLWRALRVVAARGGEGRSVGLEAPFVGRDGDPDDLLFGYGGDAPFDPRAVARKGQRAWTAANKERAEADLAPLPAFTFHEARHSFSTWLDHAGVSPDRADRYMGHSTSSTVPGRYRHLLPGQMAKDAEQLDAYLAGATAGKVVALAVGQ